MATYTGNALANSYIGTAQDDEFDMRAGDDIAYGEGGDDLIFGGWGNDSLHGGADDDQLLGEAGDDLLLGDAGNDILYGEGGHDRLFGGDNNDRMEGGDGADDLDGGAGFDYIDYHYSNVGVSINLATGAAHGGDADGDTFVNIEGVIGSTLADTLVGSAANESFVGGAGADYIDGAGGRDFADYFSSPSGVTVNLATGTGSGGHAAGDVLVNIEALSGSDFGDTFIGNAGANSLNGLDGDDTLSGAGGDDNLNGGDGDDDISGGADNDILGGGLGNDTLDGDAGFDTVNAVHWNFVTDFFPTSYSIVLGEGKNEGAATRTIFSGGGTEVEHDALRAIENVQGSEKNETITGNSGQNVLQGNGGNDIIQGGGNADIVDGGAGFDTASYASSSAGVLVNLATGSGSGGDAGGDVLVSIERVVGSAFADGLVGSDTVGNTLEGGNGDDALAGLGGNDTLNGGGGLDLLEGDAGNDTFVFRSAEANGDSVFDFTGNGAAAGDSLQFLGFGSAAQGATFTQLNATQWQIHSGLDGHNEVITLANAAAVDVSDFVFL